MIRLEYLKQLEHALEGFKIVGLLGPRQVGKTTLARELFEKLVPKKLLQTNYFDLENPRHLMRLQDPLLALENLSGLVVIDEVQRFPELFPILRVLVDRKRNSLRFLILGSASLELIKQSSESLAGRIKYIQVHPFSLFETKLSQTESLWLRGGYPLAFLAKNDSRAFDWLEQYARTFLERDIPLLGFNIPAENMRRFWMMLSHYHGQLVNYAEIARSMDVSESTAKRYLDLLVGTFMVRRLQPWHANIDKRQIKTPKIYFCDSGLFHLIVGITKKSDLLVSPKMGASWEGFAMEQVLRCLNLRPEDAYFWGIHEQCELDLLVRQGAKFHGFEIKHSYTPRVSKSMLSAMEALKLKELTVIYPGNEEFALAKNVFAVPLSKFIKDQI